MILEPGESRRCEAAVFDLDGTLVDTRPGVRAAIAGAFQEVAGFSPTGEDANLSLPLDEMIRGLDPTASPSRQHLLSEAFRRHYDSGDWKLADVYEGAEESLAALRTGGVRLFVVTNKRVAAAERVLEHFGLARYFEDVVGQAGTGAPIPKAALMSKCLAEASLDTATTVVIGDSDQDAAAARSWGMVFVAVTSGAGPLGHATAGDERVEVGSLADATAFVLAQPVGRRS